MFSSVLLIARKDLQEIEDIITKMGSPDVQLHKSVQVAATQVMSYQQYIKMSPQWVLGMYKTRRSYSRIQNMILPLIETWFCLFLGDQWKWILALHIGWHSYKDTSCPSWGQLCLNRR